MKARIIAIYLPQYHPIPENDNVWGKGFTEWTNVVQARPLFRGHYQPRIPRDLGFYDLRMPEVREEQAKLAKMAGIEGFMYWQYYFGQGKMLLERPFEEVLKSGKPDFPFCLGWANHSWQTKTWKRDSSLFAGRTMIMEQKYEGENQYRQHFLYNLPAFKDPRYLKVNGKPIFAIWNPQDNTQQISLLIKIWKSMALEYGLKGIHFVGRRYMGDKVEDLLCMGFDAVYLERIAAAMTGSDKKTFKKKIVHIVRNVLGLSPVLDKHDFGKCYKMLADREAYRDDVYPSLISGYDRSPRAGRKASIFYNFTPETWRKHIQDILPYLAAKDEDHSIVILKSWNEWGESNYMEPDLRYGTAMLDTLRDELLKWYNNETYKSNLCGDQS